MPYPDDFNQAAHDEAWDNREHTRAVAADIVKLEEFAKRLADILSDLEDWHPDTIEGDNAHAEAFNQVQDAQAAMGFAASELTENGERE